MGREGQKKLENIYKDRELEIILLISTLPKPLPEMSDTYQYRSNVRLKRKRFFQKIIF